MKPEDVLPDDVNHGLIQGVTVRKGTMGAFLNNARTWLDPRATARAREEAERDLRALVPAARALGLFEICDIRDPRLRALILGE